MTAESLLKFVYRLNGQDTRKKRGPKPKRQQGEGTSSSAAASSSAAGGAGGSGSKPSPTRGSQPQVDALNDLPMFNVDVPPEYSSRMGRRSSLPVHAMPHGALGIPGHVGSSNLAGGKSSPYLRTPHHKMRRSGSGALNEDTDTSSNEVLGKMPEGGINPAYHARRRSSLVAGMPMGLPLATGSGGDLSEGAGSASNMTEYEAMLSRAQEGLTGASGDHHHEEARDTLGNMGRSNGAGPSPMDHLPPGFMGGRRHSVAGPYAEGVIMDEEFKMMAAQQHEYLSQVRKLDHMQLQDATRTSSSGHISPSQSGTALGQVVEEDLNGGNVSQDQISAALKIHRQRMLLEGQQHQAVLDAQFSALEAEQGPGPVKKGKQRSAAGSGADLSRQHSGVGAPGSNPSLRSEQSYHSVASPNGSATEQQQFHQPSNMQQAQAAAVAAQQQQQQFMRQQQAAQAAAQAAAAGGAPLGQPAMDDNDELMRMLNGTAPVPAGNGAQGGDVLDDIFEFLGDKECRNYGDNPLTNAQHMQNRGHMAEL
eukprot:Clim_evm71s144 gene=Clim_evmTU71s144